jgi:hypothetical protein
MSDNTGEEHLDNLPDTQPQNPPDEIIPTSDTETINPNQETENMEVHHHPDLLHKPKKWKEYFLEFLMIFLAVTMGFIAENIREHITEHKNANILAESLLDDIKSDTTSLHSLIDFSINKINAADSLITIMHKPQNTWNAVSFYTNMVPMLTSVPFKSTDGTYTQMKTSGTLRYFRQSLVNIINAYDVQLKKTVYRDEVSDKGIWIQASLNLDIMNVEVVADIRFKKPITHDMYIRTDKLTTDKFINMIMMNKGFCSRSLQEYQKQLEIASKLIEALKKEYSLN